MSSSLGYTIALGTALYTYNIFTQVVTATVKARGTRVIKINQLNITSLTLDCPWPIRCSTGHSPVCIELGLNHRVGWPRVKPSVRLCWWTSKSNPFRTDFSAVKFTNENISHGVVWRILNIFFLNVKGKIRVDKQKNVIYYFFSKGLTRYFKRLLKMPLNGR